MDKEEYAKYLGQIFSNLLSLEFILRAFIARNQGEESKVRSLYIMTKGDTIDDPPRAFGLKYFSDVIKEFNSLVTKDDKIDESIIELRNTLAHGMISSESPHEDFTLIKFKKVGDSLQVEESIKMTEEWLQGNVKYIGDNVVKVVRLYEQLKTKSK